MRKYFWLLLLPATPAWAAFAEQKGEYAAVARRFFTDPQYLYELAKTDWLLLFLIVAIAILVVLSVMFGISAIKYRRENNKKAEHWKRLENSWEPLILEVLEGDKKPETMWEVVDEKDRLYFIDFLMRFARRLRGEELEMLSELARPFLKDVAPHLKYDSSAQRARAVQALGYLGFGQYLDEIVHALDDKSPLVAMTAARVLARKEHPQYIRQVIQRLYKFDSWSPRFLSTMLTGVGPEASPTLREAYADHAQPPLVRAVAAESLRELNDIPSSDVAAQVLEEERLIENGLEPDAAALEARRARVESARQTEMQEARWEKDDQYLEEEPLSDQPNPHRDLIASSLRLVRSMGRPEHADRVRPHCDSRDFVVRAFACRALGRVGEKAQDRARLERALDDNSVWVALHAARALRELGAEERLREIASAGIAVHPRSEVAQQVLAEAVR